MVHPWFVDGSGGLHIWRMTVNVMSGQSQTDDKGWYSSLGVGMKCYTGLQNWQALVNTAMHLWVPEKAGSFLI